MESAVPNNAPGFNASSILSIPSSAINLVTLVNASLAIICANPAGAPKIWVTVSL